MHCFRYIIAILSLFVQTFTFAQGFGVDSVQMVNALADSVADNTIKDTIDLTQKPGNVRFETISREGNKYYALTSEGDKVEITSIINGKTRALVKDGDGHELVIDKDGNVMGVEEYKKCGGSAKLLSEHNAHRDSTMATTGNVKFSKIKDETYGFDEWRGADYDKDVYDNFNGYRPTYIGVQKQSNIKVAVSQTKGVRFITERGVPIIANTADNTLNLAIGTTGKQTVYAYRDSTLVGKLCIQAYDTKEVKVHVVRVNNGKQLELNKIADEVNRIYSSAVVHYTFDELDPIKIEYANKQHFVHGGKGTFQNYNADQKAAIKALPENADGNDYYLFFTECYNRLDTAGNVSPEAVNGYMPVGRHYGFIYNEYDNARTIAHELGHGTNSLHHTFSQDSESFHTTEKTDNLMDYNGGEYLNHRQWQWAHEKHRNVLGFLDDEEESENISLTGAFYAILNGNENYKLYDKSTITVLAGTELSFDVLPDEYVYNRAYEYIKSMVNGEDSILSFNIKLDNIIELKNEKSEIVDISKLTIGKYTCSISLNTKSLDGLVIHDNVKKSFTLPFKRYNHRFNIKLEIVNQPIVRLEPADRENFFLKFGYDDALVKENQDRGDYPKEIIAGQSYYVPWLHIQPNVEAEMKLDFNFDEAFVSKLTSIIDGKPDKEYTLSFIVKGDNGIKINGKDSIEVSVDKTDEILKISSSAERNGFVSIYAKNFITGKSELAGKLEVCCRNMKKVGSIKFYTAIRFDENESDYPQVNVREILGFVNNYYKQAGVYFDLETDVVEKFVITTKSKDQELNVVEDIINTKKPKLDNNSSVELDWKNEEKAKMFLFRNTRKAELFIANNYHVSTRNGQTNMGYGWSYILDNINYIVIVHELGHELGLPHTFKQDEKDNRKNTIKKSSTTNIMDYESNYTIHRKLFYKYQINYIYEL